MGSLASASPYWPWLLQAPETLDWLDNTLVRYMESEDEDVPGEGVFIFQLQVSELH